MYNSKILGFQEGLGMQGVQDLGQNLYSRADFTSAAIGVRYGLGCRVQCILNRASFLGGLPKFPLIFLQNTDSKAKQALRGLPLKRKRVYF